MSNLELRFEVQHTRHLPEDIRLEIISAVAKWYCGDPSVRYEIRKGCAIIDADSIRVFLRYSKATSTCAIRYKRKWLSAQIARRCSTLNFGPALQVNYPAEFLGRINSLPMRLAGLPANTLEHLTALTGRHLGHIIACFQNDPSAFQLRRVGRSTYEIRERKDFHFIARIRISDSNTVTLEDLLFLPTVASSGST